MINLSIQYLKEKSLGEMSMSSQAKPIETQVTTRGDSNLE